jgi:hypothetical protein
MDAGLFFIKLFNGIARCRTPRPRKQPMPLPESPENAIVRTTREKPPSMPAAMSNATNPNAGYAIVVRPRANCGKQKSWQAEHLDKARKEH